MTGFSPDDTPCRPTDGELMSFAAGYLTVEPRHIDHTADDYRRCAGLVSGIGLER